MTIWKIIACDVIIMHIRWVMCRVNSKQALQLTIICYHDQLHKPGSSKRTLIQLGKNFTRKKKTLREFRRAQSNCLC